MNTEMTELNQGNRMMESRLKRKLTKRQNRCFFNLLHITTATLLIGCLELVYFSYETFSTVYHFIQTGEQYFLSLSTSLFGILLAFIASILLFVAIRTSTPYLLVPHLLMQVVAICILSLISLFFLFALVTGTSLDFRIVNVEDNTIVDDADIAALNMTNKSMYELIYLSDILPFILLFICIFLLLFGLIQVWMFIIVFRCFFYLQKKAKIVKNETFTNGNINRIRIDDKTQIFTANNATNNNCFSLEMSSAKIFRKNFK